MSVPLKEEITPIKRIGSPEVISKKERAALAANSISTASTMNSVSTSEIGTKMNSSTPSKPTNAKSTNNAAFFSSLSPEIDKIKKIEKIMSKTKTAQTLTKHKDVPAANKTTIPSKKPSSAMSKTQTIPASSKTSTTKKTTTTKPKSASSTPIKDVKKQPSEKKPLKPHLLIDQGLPIRSASSSSAFPPSSSFLKNDSKTADITTPKNQNLHGITFGSPPQQPTTSQSLESSPATQIPISNAAQVPMMMTPPSSRRGISTTSSLSLVKPSHSTNPENEPSSKVKSIQKPKTADPKPKKKSTEISKKEKPKSAVSKTPENKKLSALVENERISKTPEPQKVSASKSKASLKTAASTVEFKPKSASSMQLMPPPAAAGIPVVKETLDLKSAKILTKEKDISKMEKEFLAKKPKSKPITPRLDPLIEEQETQQKAELKAILNFQNGARISKTPEPRKTISTQFNQMKDPEITENMPQRPPELQRRKSENEILNEKPANPPLKNVSQSTSNLVSPLFAPQNSENENDSEEKDKDKFPSFSFRKMIDQINVLKAEQYMLQQEYNKTREKSEDLERKLKRSAGIIFKYEQRMKDSQTSHENEVQKLKTENFSKFCQIEKDICLIFSEMKQFIEISTKSVANLRDFSKGNKNPLSEEEQEKEENLYYAKKIYLEKKIMDFEKEILSEGSELFIFSKK